MKKIIPAIAAAVMMMSAVSVPVSADKWVKTDSGYTFEYTDGTQAKTGWLTVSKKKYYIDKNGCRHTGWLTTTKAKYYFDAKGVMYASKWLETKSGAKYYFKSDGKMASDTSIKIGSQTYDFDKDGKLIEKKGEKSQTVYITKTGKKYHIDSSCNGAKYYPVTLEEAENKNLKPCNKCCE